MQHYYFYPREGVDSAIGEGRWVHVRPRRVSDNQRDDANGERANRQMSRHCECAQYVEGCHMTDVRSDFEEHSPTMIVIFIARSVYRL